MPDYSEFPTTPTAWQERLLADWQTVSPLDTEDPPAPPRPRLDRTALVAGLVFVVLAVVGMADPVLPDLWLDDGGFLWVALVAAGLALLVRELRRSRHRRP